MNDFNEQELANASWGLEIIGKPDAQMLSAVAGAAAQQSIHGRLQHIVGHPHSMGVC